jgi:hypothetical protein
MVYGLFIALSNTTYFAEEVSSWIGSLLKQKSEQQWLKESFFLLVLARGIATPRGKYSIYVIHGVKPGWVTE